MQPHLLVQFAAKLLLPHQHPHPPPELANHAHPVFVSANHSNLSAAALSFSPRSLNSSAFKPCQSALTPSVSPGRSPRLPARLARSPPPSVSSLLESACNIALAGSPL